MKAKIQWKRSQDGGRTSPPLGIGSPSYATLVKFSDGRSPWSLGTWSLVVEKNPNQSTDYEWIAKVHFLVPEAPHHELTPGRDFELYEGKKCVATGRLLTDN
jgi:hypothetical protein